MELKAYASLYIASPISGRLPALNLNRFVRADRIDAIDFFFLHYLRAIHICMCRAVRERFEGTLSIYEPELYCSCVKKERVSTICSTARHFNEYMKEML